MNIMSYGNAEIFDARDRFPDLIWDRSRYQFTKRSLDAVDLIVIHHWASGEPSNTFESQVSQIQEVYDMWTRDDGVHNTAGFPYHLAMFPNGNAFYIGDLYTSRACVERQNPHIICISLAGNYMNEPPSDTFIERIREITENTRLIMEWNVPIVGHREIGQTSCPGDTWDQWKDRLNS
jgi:hypothetical protein